MAVAGKKKKIFDDRYEILSIVGRGSRSVVYRAQHIRGDGTEVALKVLLNRKDEISNSDLLRKEALAMVSSRHKYVIRLDDFHSVGELCYLSMEYAAEGDLRKYTDRNGGKLNPDQAELFLLQAAEALDFIHQAGILHRDIKPDNILVINAKNVRLGDFGVAVLPGEESSIEELQRGVGTMSYMSPEVLEGKSYDKRADLYALAVSFYEMLSGVHPFDQAPLIKQLEVREDNSIEPLSSLVPGIPQHLSDTLTKAMSYELDNRFQNCRELIQSLLLSRSEPKAKEAPPVAKPKAEAEKPPRPAQKQVSEKAPKEAQTEAEPAAESPPMAGEAVVEEGAKPKRKRKRRRRRGRKKTAEETAEKLRAEAEKPKAKEPKPVPTKDTPVSDTLKHVQEAAGETPPEKKPEPTKAPKPQAPKEELPPQKKSIRKPIVEPEVSKKAEKGPPEKPAVQPMPGKPAVQPMPGKPAAPPRPAAPVSPKQDVAPAEAAKPTGPAPRPGPQTGPVTPPGSKPRVGAIAGSATSEPAAKESTPPAQATVEPVPPPTPPKEPTPPEPDAGPKPGVTRVDPFSRIKSQEKNLFSQKMQGPSAAEKTEQEKEETPEEESKSPLFEKAPRSGSGSRLSSMVSQSPQRNFKPILIAVAAGFLLFIVLPSMFGGGEPEEEVVDSSFTSETVAVGETEELSSESLPAVDTAELRFPYLPAGMYSGNISGVIPDKTVPMSIISLAKRNELVVLIGIHGWKPAFVSLDEVEDRQDQPIVVRVVSNGMMLDFSGQNMDGKIVGLFRNVITDEQGEWNLVPANGAK